METLVLSNSKSKPKRGRPRNDVEKERICVHLPRPLATSIKHAAIDKRMTLSDLVADALASHFDRRS